MAHLSEYQGAIALLDLDRGSSSSTSTTATTATTTTAAQQQQRQSPQHHHAPLPRIVMPEDDGSQDDRRASRHRNRTSIADLLADSNERDQHQQQNGGGGHNLQPPHIYTNSANPPIDTQLLSPMSVVSATSPSAMSTISNASSASFSSAASSVSGVTSNVYAYVQSPVSPITPHPQPLSLPSLPSVIHPDSTGGGSPYRHHVTDPALSGVIPANPVRTGANANAEFRQASAPSSQQHQQQQSTSGHSSKREKASAGSPGASSGQTPSASRPYKCPHAGCKWTFARHSDQRRHLRSHYSPNFHCPYWRTDPTCHRNGGAFNRLDVLKRHLRLVHFVQLKDTDAGWCRLCQKMFASPRVFVEHCEKCADSVQPTEWKKSAAEGEPMPPGMPSEHA
ncbi:hypothetical protein V1509DRAFT_616660 [Lipomyces kononenkoae]